MKKRFLCVCQKGCNRSVFLAYRFKRNGHSAIPVGWMTESAETLAMMCEWADHIVVVMAEYKKKIPTRFQKKVLVVDVGRDVWGPRWADEQRKKTYAGLDALVAQGIISGR